VKTQLRRAIDTWLPALGVTYRDFRERRAASDILDTPYGFKFAGSEAMANGIFETTEVACFLQQLESADVCIDVGANLGLYSCLAASRGKRTVAIEPLESNVRLLLENLWRNGFSTTEVHPVGLARAPGISRLYGHGTAASFLRGWAATPEHGSRIVSLATLDDILGSRFGGAEMLIKVDVEGFELEVLHGSVRTLTRQPRPRWMVEICLDEHFPGGSNQNFYETFEVFWRSGYQSKIASPDARLVLPQDIERWVKRGSVDFGTHNYLFV
jgi:FkbM family methyltransferase